MAGRGDDVLQQGTANTCAACGGRGAHRLHFAVSSVQLLEGGESEQDIAVPCRPERHGRHRKPGGIKSECVAGHGGLQFMQMMGKQIRDVRCRWIVLPYLHPELSALAPAVDQLTLPFKPC